MIEAIHKHLLSEIDRAGRSDTIFVLAGVSFNLLVLFINWVQADILSKSHKGLMIDSLFIFIIFMVGTLVVSSACLLTLISSRKICNRCHEALMLIYKDMNVSKYMPEGISYLGNKRFILSFIVVSGTSLIAVVIPLVVVLLA